MNRFFKRCKILLNGLIDKDISVGQIKHFLFHTAFQKPIDDLEGGICFSGAGCHDEKKPVLSAGNGVQSAVNSLSLIVPG